MSGAATYGETVNGALRRVFGDKRQGAQRAADAARATTRAAQNWLSGLCAPNGEALVHLMAESDEIEAAVLALVQELRCRRR